MGKLHLYQNKQLLVKQCQINVKTFSSWHIKPNMTIRVNGDIILTQFSEWAHENSSDSLWHKNLKSEEQWCVKVMQNVLKKANAHLFMWNRKSRGDTEWTLIYSWRQFQHLFRQVDLENCDSMFFYAVLSSLWTLFF